MEKLIIEYFIIPKLTYLDLNDKNIEELSSLVKYSKITRLMINNNKLEHIPELPNSLKYLSFKNNLIKELPSKLPKNLLLLDCANNNIEKISELPSSLKILICNNNPIKYINISENINLVRLDCLNNDYQFSYNELPSSLEVLNRQKIIKQPELQIFDLEIDSDIDSEFDSSNNDSEKDNCCCWK